MKYFIGTLVILFFTINAHSQGNILNGMSNSGITTDEQCGNAARQQYLRSVNPDYDKQMEEMEKGIREWINRNDVDRSQQTVLTIPTVVHVLFNSPSENVSNAQVFALIDRLNKDYRRQNSDTTNTPAPFDSLAADMEIEFCLVSRDPQGYSTTGIVRRQTSATSFGINDDIKFTASGGSDAWNVNKYFNIWIGNLGAGLLGYGDFPQANLPSTYGAAIHYCTVDGSCPPFHLNRTSTHELGHCFSLFHIWGDDGTSCSGSDQVFDTPNQSSASSGCPSYPKTDNCSPNAPGIMFMNYMDYTNDACMNMFTKGQKQRAVAAVNTYLTSIITSNGCQPVTGLDAGIHQIYNDNAVTCDTTFKLEVELRNFGGDTLFSVSINYAFDAGANNTYNWSGVLAPGYTTTVNLGTFILSSGSHSATVFTSNPNAGTDINPGNNGKSVNFNLGSIGTITPFTEGFESGVFPPAGWTLFNPDGSYTWERTTQASSLGNASAFMNNYDYAANGEVDELFIKKIDLSNAQNPLMTFDVAYALYTATGFSDTLQVWVSEDCGANWLKVYHKFDAALTTVPGIVTNVFIPNPTQWRKDTIDLSAFAGSTGLLIKFRHVTDYENNLYIDNVNIASSINTGLSNLQSGLDFKVYPNPANNLVCIEPIGVTVRIQSIAILDIMGRQVFSELNKNEVPINIDISAFSPGIYLLEIQCESELVTKKLVIAK